jgi:hypothetical protein
VKRLISKDVTPSHFNSEDLSWELQRRLERRKRRRVFERKNGSCSSNQMSNLTMCVGVQRRVFGWGKTWIRDYFLDGGTSIHGFGLTKVSLYGDLSQDDLIAE